MKINGKEVTGTAFAFDHCHKVYVCANEEEERDAERSGYTIYPIEEITEAWEGSCPLRFISCWSLDKDYVRQFEDAVFEES